MRKYTFSSYEARLGLTGTRRCIVPDEVAADQSSYDGRTFPALVYWAGSSYRTIRVRLCGADYGLHSSGTGDMIVRPLSKPFGHPRAIDGHNKHGRYTESPLGNGC
jgi:hypothetical protein